MHATHFQNVHVNFDVPPRHVITVFDIKCWSEVLLRNFTQVYINCTSGKDKTGCRDMCKTCGFDGGVHVASPVGCEGLLICK